MPPDAAGPAHPAATPSATTTTAATTTTVTTTTTAAAPAAVAPKTAKPITAAKPAAKKTTWPQNRPVAFTVPGAGQEPLDEMPLTNRAQLLRSWLEAHPTKTSANVAHWSYQNAWIVAGAKFGWWHGAE